MQKLPISYEFFAKKNFFLKIPKILQIFFKFKLFWKFQKYFSKKISVEKKSKSNRFERKNRALFAASLIHSPLHFRRPQFIICKQISQKLQRKNFKISLLWTNRECPSASTNFSPKIGNKNFGAKSKKLKKNTEKKKLQVSWLIEIRSVKHFKEFQGIGRKIKFVEGNA